MAWAVMLRWARPQEAKHLGYSAVEVADELMKVIERLWTYQYAVQ